MALTTGRRDIGVALGIPEPYTSELQGWRERLGDSNAAAIPPHVTLLPPTNLTAGALDAVEEHLAAIAERGWPFVLHLRGSGTFRPVSPVVFVPLVGGHEECVALEARVRSGPLARDLHFPYHPHVTVAHDVPEVLLDEAEAALSSYDARFRVWGLTLFEKGRDRVWRPLRDFPFGSGVPGPARAPDPVAG